MPFGQVIDDFNRADQAGLGAMGIGGTLTGDSWSSPIEAGNGSLNVAGNAASESTSPPDSNYSGRTYGPSVRCGFKLKTRSASSVSSDGIGIYWAIQSPGGAALDGYEAYFTAEGTYRLDRVVDGGFTSLGTQAGTFAAGDVLDVESIVTAASVAIRVLKNGTQVLSATDTNAARISLAGPVGLQIFGTATDWEIEEAYAHTIGAERVHDYTTNRKRSLTGVRY